MQVLSDIIIILGIIFTAFGVVGIYRFDNFYARILVAAKIDTVGVITLLFGLMLRHGFGFFSLKLVIIGGILLILNPLVTHIVARAAYLSGYREGIANTLEIEQPEDEIE